MKKYILIIGLFVTSLAFSQGYKKNVYNVRDSVSVFTTTPLQKFHVEGKSYFSDFVGIGTTSPSNPLHIYTNTTDPRTATIEQDGTGDASIIFGLTGVVNWITGIDNSDGDKFKINSNNDLSAGTAVLTIQTDGNVGINKTDPSEKLEVVGNGLFSGNLTANSFIKDGGLSTEFLKADGSVSTGGGGGVPYKEYTATLAQTSTNAPVATVIFNDLGQVPVWTRTGVGLYSLTVTGNAWVLNKTIVHLTNANTSGGGLSGKVSSTSIIGVFAFATSTGSNSDIWEGTITVKVYD